MREAHRQSLLAMEEARIAVLHSAAADDVLIVLGIDGVWAQLARLSRWPFHRYLIGIGHLQPS